MAKKNYAHAVEAMRSELAARDADEQVAADHRLSSLERAKAPPRLGSARRTDDRRSYDALRHHHRLEILRKIDEQSDYVALLREARACLLASDAAGFERAVAEAIVLRVREEVHAMTLDLVERLTRLVAPHAEEEEH